MAKKILCVLIVLCTVFTAVEVFASAASNRFSFSNTRTASTTTTTTATASNSINQITVGGDNTATLTASSIYGATSAYRKNTSASRWTKTSAKSAYGAVIASYDIYSVVMADLQARYPLAEGYTYSSINIVATATISVKATNATSANTVSVYYNSAAQSAQATAYNSTLTRTAFTFRNSKNGSGTISVPSVSAANPYLVVYAASPVNTIAVYAPTVSISYSYTAAIVKVATGDTTASTQAPSNTTSSTTSTTTSASTTTTTQAPIITTSKAPTTSNTTKKSFLSGWCPWL